jgi:SSS family solute:Na+ symporter
MFGINDPQILLGYSLAIGFALACVITTLVLGVGIGVLAQPQLVIRFMTAKNNRSLNRAVMIGGPIILMMTGVAFTVGALTNVYFYQTLSKIAV